MNDFYWENHGRGFFMVTQISVAGTLIACHLFIFQIIVHFFKTKKLLPPSHQSSTWSMDRSLLHISFLRLFIIRDTFINKVNYALACRFAPFFSIINFNEKKNYTFLWSGHYKGNQFLIKLGCWCWYLTILQLSFLIHVHVYLLST